MLIQSKSLPDKFVGYLKKQPETGMGYQIVTIFTKEGKCYERVHILNANEIATVDGNTDIPFNPNDIIEVIVTHDKTI
jgi:hypothetical protein